MSPCWEDFPAWDEERPPPPDRGARPGPIIARGAPKAQGTGGAFRGIESAAAFCRRWTPPAYIVDGVLARGRVQALTAYTGHGKTTTALHLALCIARGEPFGSHETELGAVLILAGENPDLVVGQFRAACLAANVRPEDVPVHFHYGRFSVSQNADALAEEARGIEGLSLIIADTHQAFFEGDNDNDNTQALAAAHKWRPFAESLPTKPSVLVPSHPAGKKPDRENLVPRGGSAFMNELDGNFCLWRQDGLIRMHWQGKHRGPSFEPIDLKLDLREHPDIIDSKGRAIPMPVVRSLLTAERIVAERQALDTNARALTIIRERPNVTIRDLGAALQLSKSRAGEIVKGLIQDGLIHRHERQLKLTQAGTKWLNDAGL